MVVLYLPSVRDSVDFLVYHPRRSWLWHQKHKQKKQQVTATTV